MPSFWNNIVHIFKVMSLLVRVLCVVDNERKSAMCYIYGEMIDDRCKTASAQYLSFIESDEKSIILRDW